MCPASGPLMCIDAISLGRGESNCAITSFFLAQFKSNFEKVYMEFLIKKITHTILYYFLSGRLCKEQSQPRAFGLYEEAQEGIPSRPH